MRTAGSLGLHRVKQGLHRVKQEMHRVKQEMRGIWQYGISRICIMENRAVREGMPGKRGTERRARCMAYAERVQGFGALIA